MNAMRRLVCLVVALSAVASMEAAARTALPAEVPTVDLFDTKQPLAGRDPGEGLRDVSGWERVPQDQLDHAFRGDAIVTNRRIAVVLRSGSRGAEVYSRFREAWTKRAVLVPCRLKQASPDVLPGASSVSVKPTVNDGETVAVEAAFQSRDGKTARLVCELRQAAVFVKAEPRGETSRLRIESAGRFGVIPDFYADDIVLDAARIPVSQSRIPSENMFVQRLDGDALAVSLWDGPPQDIAITLAGKGDARRIEGLEIDWARPGKAYLAVLDFPGACYAGMFDRLPDRSEPIAGFKLEKPVKRLEWQMPFPAQWRVDFATDRVGGSQAVSREMSAPYPYPVKDGRCREFRFIKPSYVWDWAGGTQTEMSGTPDKYPTWVDLEGRGFARPAAGSYAVLVYPFDRGRGTPLESLTLTDLVRQTLGVGPCRYILDADRRMAQTPGIFTCGGTDMLKKMQDHISQRRAEAEKLLDGMVIFMKAYRRRIEQYSAFKRQLIAYLDSQPADRPDKKTFARKIKSLLEPIPTVVTPDYPKIVEQLAAEYRATLHSDEPAARKKRAELHPRFPAAGGAQDGVLAACHQAAKLVRYQAGLALAADPGVTAVAVEVRRQASAVLENPMYHETKDRHR
jgi:hypothetical protein